MEARETKTKTKGLLRMLEKLSNEIVTDPEKLKRFIKEWSHGFKRYSLTNWVLIKMQRPTATLCAGYKQWAKVGRHVKKGEKGIAILAPRITRVYEMAQDLLTGEVGETEVKVIRGFFTVYVFDISQTEGQPVELGCPQMVRSKQKISLDDIISKFEIPVVFRENSLENGSTDGKTIWITKRNNEASMIATFFHELAHVMLKHCDENTLIDFDNIDRNIKELEAEAVSYICCEAIGIENERSYYYIGNWTKNAKEDLKRSGMKILATAEKILNKIMEDQHDYFQRN